VRKVLFLFRFNRGDDLPVVASVVAGGHRKAFLHVTLVGVIVCSSAKPQPFSAINYCCVRTTNLSRRPAIKFRTNRIGSDRTANRNEQEGRYAP